MALLSADGLTKRFGGLAAVDRVNFAVEGGELVGIIGPNGAGKTTLFNLLTGFLRPDQGAATFRGRRITGLPPHQVVNLGVTRTFQVVRPFVQMSVLENVAVACVSSRGSRMRAGATVADAAVAALSAVGLEERAAALVDTLPFGDLKRLEIARALATEPDVLLLDEPFAGLSASENTPILELITELSRRGITMLIVEHKLRELMRVARRVIVMHFGQIIATGTPEDVARRPAVIEAYLGGAA